MNEVSGGLHHDEAAWLSTGRCSADPVHLAGVGNPPLVAGIVLGADSCQHVAFLGHHVRLESQTGTLPTERKRKKHLVTLRDTKYVLYIQL